MRDHRSLRAFLLADELVFQVYDLVTTLPDAEKYGLTSQLRRSALSVPANIVEGCGRATERELVHFLHIANGSLRETEYHISVVKRLNYVPAERCERVEAHVRETAKTLYGYFRSLSPDS